MRPVQLDITLVIQGPFLTQSSAPGDYGVSAVVARSNGRPYIAGSHITGKLRQAWEELGRIQDRQGRLLLNPQIEDWLGKECEPSPDRTSTDCLQTIRRWLEQRWPAARATGVEPQRKRLLIGDLHLCGEPITAQRYRIRIDAERGAVQQGALQLRECLDDGNGPLTFQGSAWALVPDGTEVETLRRHVEVGLKWITQVGAERTTGFGRLIEVRVSRGENPQLPEPRELAVSAGERADFDYRRLDLIIRPQGTLCIAEHGSRDNLFRMAPRPSLPGGAVKGAIATMWCALRQGKSHTVTAGLDPERPDLAEHFDRLRFTHAFPGQGYKRPVVPPLSLVQANQFFYDTARCPEPGVFRSGQDDNCRWEAPAFAIDWKDDSDVRKYFGWPEELAAELRVRTRIDKTTRRAAEEQLFAYEQIVPGGYDWYGQVDLSAIEEQEVRQRVAAQLASLLTDGLHGLSKTKAYAEVTLHPAGLFKSAQPSNFEAPDNLWVITLQTPALLCDPAGLNETSDAAALHASYADAWETLSGGALKGALKLERYFARQSLSGGYYLYRRFQYPNPYQPYLLTEAGSVFVLKAENMETVFSCMKRWQQQGLPLPAWVQERYRRNGKPGDHWSNCPYIPANGYGEIAVNLAWENPADMNAVFEPILEQRQCHS